MRQVFEAYPQAVFHRNLFGNTPIFFLFHNRTPSTYIQALLESRPSIAIERIKAFADRDLVTLVCSPWTRVPSNGFDRIYENDSFEDHWRKVVYTVQAAYACRMALDGDLDEDDRDDASKDTVSTSSSSSSLSLASSSSLQAIPSGITNKPHSKMSKSFPLHEALECDECPLRVLQWFARYFRLELQRPLLNGMYPIHKLFVCGSMQSHLRHIQANESSNDTDKVIEKKSCAQDVVEEFLVHHPDSANAVHAGRLPLHTAIVSGCTWDAGLKILVQTHPPALQAPCEQTGLLPFMLAASSDLQPVDTVFELLRQEPFLVSTDTAVTVNQTA